MSAQDPAAFAEGVYDILKTNYLGTASMVVLLYDQLLTFDDEVNYVWKGHKGIVFYLFMINRYITPFGFIINMFAYMSPLFTEHVCSHFFKYEGAFTTVNVGIAALMMICRVNALYNSNRIVQCILGFVFSIQVGVQAWLLSGARMVPHTDGEHNCTMILAGNIGNWPSAYAWTPLIFDSTVLFLTLFRTLGLVRHGSAGRIVKTLIQDGVLYYSVIFSSNLVLAVMIVGAPDGIKGIAAQYEQLITVTMMSRITINLKKNTVSNPNPTIDTHVSTFRAIATGSDTLGGTTKGTKTFWSGSGKKADVDIETVGPLDTFEMKAPASEVSRGRTETTFTADERTDIESNNGAVETKRSKLHDFFNS